MFCHNCGTQIDDEMSFCPQCGAKTDAESVPPQATEPAAAVDSGAAPDSGADANTPAVRQAAERFEPNPAAGAAAPKVQPAKHEPSGRQGWWKRSSKFKKVLIVLAAVVVVVIALSLLFSQPGDGVRNAYLSQYSDKVTIEEAFDSFFADGKWDEYDAGGYSYVTYTGTCEYLGEPADARITFRITDDWFVVNRLDINGVEQDDLTLSVLLDQIYEDY